MQPFTVGFPRADIHQLLAPDLLHQVIKGTFKDHLVTWVEDYLVREHGKAGAAVIMADIDRRCVVIYGGLLLQKTNIHTFVGSLPSHIFRVYVAFLRAEVSNSGPETIPRLL